MKKVVSFFAWWAGNNVTIGACKKYIKGSRPDIQFPNAIVQKVFDPQKVLQHVQTGNGKLVALVNTEKGR